MTGTKAQLGESAESGAAPASPWLTLNEAALLSRYCRRTLLRAIEAGRLRSTQHSVGCRHNIHRDDLDAWMNGKQPVGGRRGPRAA